MQKGGKVHGLACSIFQKEIELLKQQGKINIPFEYIDSELHMKPLQLKEVLKSKIKPHCVICYGKCEPRLDKNTLFNDIAKTEGLNCVEIILGNKLYRKLRAEGAFFLLPEWTHKWERIFKDLLGLSDIELAQQFMNEMHTKMIYVNTGIVPIPHKTLTEIEGYFNIPIEVIDIKLDELEKSINFSIKKLNNED
jgi:hypothetical protein